MRISYVVFALAAMICWRVAPLFGKAAMLRIDPGTGLAMRSFVISLIMLIWVIVTGYLRHLVQTEFSNWGLIHVGGMWARDRVH